MVRASRESVAYRLDEDGVDTSRFAGGDKKRRSSAGAEPEKGKKKGARGVRMRRKIRLVTPARLFCGIFVVFMCAGMIYSQMRLTQLTNQISERQVTLEDLASEQVALTSKYEQQYNADFIADYAENTLGMVKLGTAQVEYLELSSPDEIEVSRDTATISGAVGGLVRGFTAILEYLR